MITGEYSIIRTAESDDAFEMGRLYDPAYPRACLLDRKRELLVPTMDELRELLARKDKLAGQLQVIEDRAGNARGFCALRAAETELNYAEMVLMLFEESSYQSPLADEVFEYFSRVAFVHRKHNKLMAQCLDGESAYRAFLLGKEFRSDGVQREAFFSSGRWHNLESLTRFRNQE
ncbi:MAG: hypothetical protein HY706_17525 [Candidatus Hydrogenedentes bacterium]|nr:hypothetical protein [Candidatus Hydrogenedentota bacterium]